MQGVIQLCYNLYIIWRRQASSTVVYSMLYLDQDATQWRLLHGQAFPLPLSLKARGGALLAGAGHLLHFLQARAIQAHPRRLLRHFPYQRVSQLQEHQA